MTKQCGYQINDKLFIEIIKGSKNIRQALLAMGLNDRGAAYKILNKRCKQLQVSPPKTGDKNIRATTTNEQIISACENNFSRKSTLESLKLKYDSGSNVRWINKQIEILKINITHWLGQAHLKGKTHNWAIKIPLENILIENSTYTSTYHLKLRLIDEKLFDYKCSKCNIIEWNSEKISLQLDHINGNHNDNRIENLRLLCPNCHSQTETFAGKNIGNIN